VQEDRGREMVEDGRGGAHGAGVRLLRHRRLRPGDGMGGAAGVIRPRQAQRLTPACLAAVPRGPSLQPSTSLRRTASSRHAAS
jgi:hypothetical protein